MARDRADLQTWYRQAMRRRIEELRALRSRLEACDEAACDQARAIGQALRGSGATFGFPRLSDLAARVETSEDLQVLRRVEGLITELDALSSGDVEGRSIGPEWLARAAGVPEDSVADATGSAEAWSRIAGRIASDPATLARRVADYFRLDVADLSSRSRAAQRLVPEALAVGARVVPLREDSVTITVASADPTALVTEHELERLTGRQPIFAVAPPGAIDAALRELYGDANGAAPSSPPRAVVPRTEGHAAAGAQHGILVVDDEPAARLLVRALLEKRGYRVAEAGDGLEALDLVRAEPTISLVVADLNMPRMDGLELIWELRDSRHGEHVPVIVVTGEVDEILETQLMEEGADDYVRKPIDPRLFLARIEATIRRSLD